jgi:hypothetical protein
MIPTPERTARTGYKNDRVRGANIQALGAIDTRIS